MNKKSSKNKCFKTFSNFATVRKECRNVKTTKDDRVCDYFETNEERCQKILYELIANSVQKSIFLKKGFKGVYKILLASLKNVYPMAIPFLDCVDFPSFEEDLQPTAISKIKVQKKNLQLVHIQEQKTSSENIEQGIFSQKHIMNKLKKEYLSKLKSNGYLTPLEENDESEKQNENNLSPTYPNLNFRKQNSHHKLQSSRRSLIKLNYDNYYGYEGECQKLSKGQVKKMMMRPKNEDKVKMDLLRQEFKEPTIMASIQTKQKLKNRNSEHLSSHYSLHKYGKSTGSIFKQANTLKGVKISKIKLDSSRFNSKNKLPSVSQKML